MAASHERGGGGGSPAKTRSAASAADLNGYEGWSIAHAGEKIVEEERAGVVPERLEGAASRSRIASSVITAGSCVPTPRVAA